jgi:hypothetical protein
VTALCTSSLQATAAAYIRKLVLLSFRSLASQQPCVRHAGLHQGLHLRCLLPLAFTRTPPPATPRTAFLVASVRLGSSSTGFAKLCSISGRARLCALTSVRPYVLARRSLRCCQAWPRLAPASTTTSACSTSPDSSRIRDLLHRRSLHPPGAKFVSAHARAHALLACLASTTPLQCSQASSSSLRPRMSAGTLARRRSPQVCITTKGASFRRPRVCPSRVAMLRTSPRISALAAVRSSPRSAPCSGVEFFFIRKPSVLASTRPRPCSPAHDLVRAQQHMLRRPQLVLRLELSVSTGIEPLRRPSLLP